MGEPLSGIISLLPYQVSFDEALRFNFSIIPPRHHSLACFRSNRRFFSSLGHQILLFSDHPRVTHPNFAFDGEELALLPRPTTLHLYTPG